MALSLIEQVRLLIGDTKEPYVMEDQQIQYFLDINDDDVEDAAEDASVALAQILAVQAVDIRTEELWESRSKTAEAYKNSIESANKLKASSAYPIIGGSSVFKGSLINQFDLENDYEDYPIRDDFEDES